MKSSVFAGEIPAIVRNGAGGQGRPPSALTLQLRNLPAGKNMAFEPDAGETLADIVKSVNVSARSKSLGYKAIVRVDRANNRVIVCHPDLNNLAVVGRPEASA